VPFGETDRADVQRDEPLGFVRAEDELGRPATDVDDEVRPGDVDAHRGAQESQLSFLFAGDHVRLDARRARNRADEIVSVRGVADGARGDDADRVRAQMTAPFDVARDGRRGAAERLRREPSIAIDPLAEPRDDELAVDVTQRTSLIFGDENANRVGSDVDDADTHQRRRFLPANPG